MIVIHCCDSWSTIVMMIILFYCCDSSRHTFQWIFIDYSVYFMQPTMFSLHERCNPDHSLAHYSTIFSSVLRWTLLHDYTNIAVADLRALNFSNIQYYCDMFLYYRDSGKIWLSPSPNIDIGLFRRNVKKE